MLKCVNYNNKGMSWTGSKVMKLIQAKNIPGIDLFVRETMQNSSDAIRDDAPYGIIEYKIGKFNTKQVADQFDKISNELINQNGETSNYIAVIDKNTTGLLGDYKKNGAGKRNLYNLLYEIMEGKDNSFLGGGHGIGKTISSKFGNGITIYYSRTYEKNQYIHKLAATLVENEKKDDRLMKFADDGIAYFGDRDEFEDCAMPIYDEVEIASFLSLFGLDIYKNDETGTITLIPFYRESEFLSYHLYDEDPIWKNNLEQALAMAIQRWYFPRIDNDEYKGKKIQIRINGLRLHLNSFFIHLQQLYNGKEIGSIDKPIFVKKISKETEVGRFRFKKFNSKELEIGVAPNNLPPPYMLLDINCSGNSKNEPIYFYTRRPGMIINYKDNFTRVGEEELDYMIGVFVLNDELNYEDENLSVYFKATEVAKHDSWEDSNIIECPKITSRKPFKVISSEITNLMKSLYVKDSSIIPNNSIDKLKKILGEKLLPPEDYGDEPIDPGVTPPVGPVIQNMKKVSTKFIGFDGDTGCIKYLYNVKLNKNDTLVSNVMVDSKFKKYTIEEWDSMGFSSPVSLLKIDINKILFKSDEKSIIKERLINDSIINSGKKNIEEFVMMNERIFDYQFNYLKNDEAKGFKIINASFETLIIEMILYLTPKDLTSSIAISSQVNKEK